MSSKLALNKRASAFLFPLVLALYEVVIYLSNDAYLPGLPRIADDIHTSDYLVQWTITTWFLGSASMQLLLGPMCDRLGRRFVLLTGGAIFVASTIGCALTDHISLLLIFRFIQGMTIPSMVVAGYATIHELYDQEKAVHTIAFMTNFVILAPAFGPLFGAGILCFSTWRWIFAILGLWGFIVVSALYFLMPEVAPKSKEKIRLKTTVAQYKNIISNRAFMLYGMSFQSLFAVLIAWITVGPFLLMEKFGFTPLQFGIIQVYVFGSFIVSISSVKHVMKRLELSTMIKVGVSLAFTGGIYALISAMLFPESLNNIIISMMLIAIGAGLSFPVFNRLAVEACNEQSMNSKIAIWSFLVSVSGILGSIVISNVYNGSMLSLSVILAIFTILPVILCVLNSDLKARSISNNSGLKA